MFKVSGVNVWGLFESMVASGFPMLKEPMSDEEYNREVGKLKEAYAEYRHDEHKESLFNNLHMKRAIKLGNRDVCTGHDNYLSGIVVQMNLTCTQYFLIQLERYHFLQIVSSMSKMHSLVNMDVEKNTSWWVSHISLRHVRKQIKEYNKAKTPEEKYERFMVLMNNLPMGYLLTMRISTNYLQIKNIVMQRRNHRLRGEWEEGFIDWVRSLPLFGELTGVV